MQKGGAMSRYIQKQKIERQYAKQAREAAKQTAKTTEKTAVTTEKLAARAVAFVKRHPVGGVAVPCLFSAAGAHAVVYVLCGDDWQRLCGGHRRVHLCR